jgi:O-methyltransferase involved in polyketide biosynthesis
LKPICNRRTIKADFSSPDDDWHKSLISDTEAFALDPTQRSAWLLEGLVMYLSESDVCRLLEKAALVSCKRSKLCVSFVNRASLLHTKQSSSDVLKTWQFGCDEFKLFLKENFLDRHWKVVQEIEVLSQAIDDLTDHLNYFE